MINFRNILRFTPFKAGCLVVLAACLMFLSYRQKPELLSALDSRGVDSMFRLRGPVATTDSVAIVDIDEKSLNALGQWPWSRDVIARLVINIRDAGAKVIGFDVVFAEEDRTSPHLVLGRLIKQAPQAVVMSELESIRNDESLDHDMLFGKAVASMPSVLGYVFLTKNDGLKNLFDVPFPSINLRSAPENIPFDELSLIPAYRAIVNVPAVAQSMSEGFFNFFPDTSGMVRKVPLFISMDGIPYPSLALEMLRLGLGENAAVLHISQRVQAEKKGVLGVSIGEYFIPSDDFAQMTINFRGPVGTFPYVPAIDIIEGRKFRHLKDKYVLLGTTAAGLHDLRSTPFSTIYPGVEIHATIIDNFLAGDPLTHDPVAERGLTLTLLIFGGLFLSAVLAYCSPLVGALGSLLFLGGALVGNYYFFFLDNKIIGMSYPILVILTIFSVVSVFNFFFEGQKRRFINMAFSRYVSPKVVEELKKHPGKLTLSGEEKYLSVLFSDIRGFTTISEQMQALQLGRFMNQYLTAMSRIVLQHNGTVDKFIGDAIMAIWNAPLDDAQHAANSVRTALKMIECMNNLREIWEKEGLPSCNIGVGINTGRVSVGNFGSEERFDYTVLGDNVNLAARLEGITKQYGVPIVISEYTRDEIGSQFSCRRLDRVKVKGKDRPVEIYEPLVEGLLEPSLRQQVDAFETALDQYFAGKFASAKVGFLELQRSSPHPLYSLYLERTEACILNPPPPEWNGVTTFATK